MKKIISLLVIGFILSGCSLFRTHKTDVEQGNIIMMSEVSRLHIGMSEAQVRDVMGEPVLKNIFTPNYIAYVYTFQKGHDPIRKTRIVCIFQNGRLQEIQR